MMFARVRMCRCASVCAAHRCMGGQHFRVFFFAYDLLLGAGALLGLPPSGGMRHRDGRVLTSKRVLIRGRTMFAHKAFHHTKYNDNSLQQKQQPTEQCDRSFRSGRSIDAGGGLSIIWAPTPAPTHHRGVKTHPPPRKINEFLFSIIYCPFFML